MLSWNVRAKKISSQGSIDEHTISKLLCLEFRRPWDAFGFELQNVIGMEVCYIQARTSARIRSEARLVSRILGTRPHGPDGWAGSTEMFVFTHCLVNLDSIKNST